MVTVLETMATTDALERVGTALADPTRRRILLTLNDGPAYPADLADALGPAARNISNHLAVPPRLWPGPRQREGRQVRYELASPRLAHALDDLVALELEVDEPTPDLDGRG